jgi:hypothetical protein
VTTYADLADLPEEDRIAIIGSCGEEQIVGFYVEDDVKADRYLMKLLTRFRVRLVGRGPGLFPGMIFIRIGPAES